MKRTYKPCQYLTNQINVHIQFSCYRQHS